MRKSDMPSSLLRGLSLLTGAGLTLLAVPASADVEIAPLVVIDLSAFDGSGFDPEPAAGQLDSDDWSVVLRPEPLNSVEFGQTNDDSDYGRGVSMGGEDDPGIWAFDVDGAGLIALGVQPTDTIFTSGDLRLRLINNTGADITEFQVEYTVWVNNDEERSNDVLLQQSADNITYTDVGVALVSPLESDANGFTATDLMEVVTPDAAIADGSQYYIAWHGDDDPDMEGDGNRDEFGIEGITIRLLNVCGNGLMEDAEECDDGLDNADTAACTSTCTTAVCGDGFVQDAVEECDDSNTDDGDGCSATCTTEVAADSSGTAGDTAADESGSSSDTDASATGASATGASATGATATSASSDSDSDTDADDTGSGGEEDDTSGCTCDSSGGGAPIWGMFGLVGLGLARRRRR
jgi:uncharacterized protein (TIGR03382 family)